MRPYRGQCSVEGCGKELRSRSLCAMHYHRMLRNGHLRLVSAQERWDRTIRNRERDRIECGADLEMLGLHISASEAARRCGVARGVALAILAPLHRRVGNSSAEAARILGVSERTVERYQAADRKRQYERAA